MSDDFLAGVIGTLEDLERGMSGSELGAALDRHEALFRTAGGRSEDFGRFRRLVNGLQDKLRDSSLSEMGLNMLIETTHDLSNTLALGDLLRTIVTRARSLAGANIAWVTFLDEEESIFRLVTSEGFLSPGTTQMTSHVEYGAVSLIMKSKSFFETQDYLNDRRFRHLRELDDMFRTESIVSLAGFPILSESRVLGLLFIADRYPRKLSGREISVLGSFALHAGVAMQNAKAFEMLSDALDEAERNRSALEQYIQRVEASAATHDEMANLLASGAEVEHFLQRMANQIDGAVILFDDNLKSREEFTSASYMGKLAGELKSKRIDPALLIAANADSRHSGRSAVMHVRDGEQCRAMALHGDLGRGETLVICHQGELTPIEIRNLERSAVALSIAKLWSEKRESERLIASSTLLRHLLLVSPPDTATISGVRDRLDLQVEEPTLLAVIRFTGLDRTSQTGVVRECAQRTDTLVDLLDEAYVAIGPVAAVRSLLANLERARNGWTVGGILSEEIRDLAGIAETFAQMSRALQTLVKMGAVSRMIDYAEVNLFARIFETGDPQRLSRHVDAYLSGLDAKAPRQARQLKDTLLCYFESQYNLKQTAEKLGIHVNTVRQRLEALETLTGGWSDPVRALELHVALRLDLLID